MASTSPLAMATSAVAAVLLLQLFILALAARRAGLRRRVRPVGDNFRASPELPGGRHG